MTQRHPAKPYDSYSTARQLSFGGSSFACIKGTHSEASQEHSLGALASAPPSPLVMFNVLQLVSGSIEFASGNNYHSVFFMIFFSHQALQ